MRPYDLILKKRRGQSLTDEEIDFFIAGYTKGDIPDYQMAALCMAIYFQGMDSRETSALTMSMVRSGQTLDLGAIAGRKIDKHSTGGVGDTTTLVLAPLVASCGVPVAKMSGRGLGHTGGTIDKLESIPGFRADLSTAQFIEQVNRIKVSVMGQTAELAPADKHLYALRDVTATVESIPLIASSIMSKKIAAGADGFVLDVKTGQGAFMQNFQDAEDLAKTMVAIGTHVGRETVALVTDMSQPLGYAIGNALEVKEAIATLKGEGPDDLLELCLHLGQEMLLLAGQADDRRHAADALQQKLESGEALECFGEFIAAQGGDRSVIERPELLPAAPHVAAVPAPSSGYVTGIDSMEAGLTAMTLGAGRVTKDSQVLADVGIELCKKLGAAVRKSETLAYIHARSQEEANSVTGRLQQSFTVEEDPPETISPILGRITKADL